MPLVPLQSCAGNSGDPCKFSTDRPGKPEQVTAVERQCAICKHIGISSLLASNLSLLYISDYEIYQAALDRLPVDEQQIIKSRVRARLKSMCPAVTTRLRKTKLLTAVNELLKSLVGPLLSMNKAIVEGSRGLLLANMVRKRRRLPSEVFHNVCAYLVFDKEAVCDHLLHIKLQGYAICRHPAFCTQAARMEELSETYRNAVKLHKTKIRFLGIRLLRASGIGGRVQFERYRTDCVLAFTLAKTISLSPELKEGRSAAHDNFHPRQLP